MSHISQLDLDYLHLIFRGNMSCIQKIGHINLPLLCVQRLFCTGESGWLQPLKVQNVPEFWSLRCHRPLHGSRGCLLCCHQPISKKCRVLLRFYHAAEYTHQISGIFTSSDAGGGRSLNHYSGNKINNDLKKYCRHSCTYGWIIKSYTVGKSLTICTIIHSKT